MKTDAGMGKVVGTAGRATVDLHAGLISFGFFGPWSLSTITGKCFKQWYWRSWLQVVSVHGVTLSSTEAKRFWEAERCKWRWDGELGLVASWECLINVIDQGEPLPVDTIKTRSALRIGCYDN